MRILAEYYKGDKLIYYLVELDDGRIITTKDIKKR